MACGIHKDHDGINGSILNIEAAIDIVKPSLSWRISKHSHVNRKWYIKILIEHRKVPLIDFTKASWSSPRTFGLNGSRLVA